MDILSSLATLSFDKRRSDFFTNELITILQLIERGIIDHIFYMVLGLVHLVIFNLCLLQLKIMQLIMIKIILLNLNQQKIHLLLQLIILNKIGWKKNQPCFLRKLIK